METNRAVLDQTPCPCQAARYGALRPSQRLPPGVVPLANAPSARAHRLRAAVHLAGPDGVVTGREAMWLHGLRVPALGAIHVLAPPGGQARCDGEVTVEITDRPPNALWRKGFPAAGLERATVDACRKAHEHGEVRQLVQEAIHRGLVRVDALHEELSRTSGNRTTLLRRVLAEIDRGIAFTGARVARDLVERAGLPSPRWGARLSTVDDVHLGTVDAWWDDVGLAWDTDVHRPWAARTPDAVARRVARFAAHGVVAAHATATRVRKDPNAVVHELREAYLLAAARPRPKVVVS